MAEAASVADLRNQLEIAQMLAKARVGFVVVPVATRRGYELLCRHQAKCMEAIAAEAEEAQKDTTK